MKLRYLADLRSILFIFTYFALVVYQWSWAPQSPLVAGLLLVLTGFFSFFCAVITHNAIHSPMFEKRWANRVAQVILSLSYGSTVSAFVPGHNLSHHKHTQSARDVMRTTKVRHSWNLLNMIEFAPRVALAIMKSDAAYSGAMKRSHAAWFRQYRIESLTVLGVTVVLFALDWKKAILYWILPHLYAAWGIISINYLQHDGCDPAHPYNHSRNFVGSWVNFWTFNNGYHGMHHDTPGLHWSRLPEAHARKIAPYVDPRLDQGSMLAFIFHTFVWPGRRVTFDGQPVQLPPPVPDETWIPAPEETSDDMGAIAVG